MMQSNQLKRRVLRMGSEGSLILDRILWGAIDSFPSVITIISGFFIFHTLASRRQRRDEIFKIVEFIRGIIDEAVEDAKSAWVITGLDAVKQGHVFSLRARLIQISLEIDHLCEENKQFGEVQELFSEFRAAVDEVSIETNDGIKTLNVDDQSRQACDRPPQPIYIAARNIQIKLNKIYSSIYGN